MYKNYQVLGPLGIPIKPLHLSLPWHLSASARDCTDYKWREAASNCCSSVSLKSPLVKHPFFQENYNTPRHRTPQAIPLAKYERNPIIACW